MKKFYWILILVIGINLILFPKRCNVMSVDNTNYSYKEKTSLLYLSPIWSESFENHLILLSPLPQSNNPNVTFSAYAVTDFDGKVKEPASKPAYDIWAMYYFIPTLLIILLPFFLVKRKSE